jgi:hypothetical protein
MNTKAQKGGGLDARFETWMRKWQVDHPMFSADEQKDPQLVETTREYGSGHFSA